MRKPVTDEEIAYDAALKDLITRGVPLEDALEGMWDAGREYEHNEALAREARLVAALEEALETGSSTLVVDTFPPS